MADFAQIRVPGPGKSKTQDYLWINLDYVVKIEVPEYFKDPRTVIFSDGSQITLKYDESRKLIEQLNQCCIPRKINTNPPDTAPKTATRASTRTAAKPIAVKGRSKPKK
jgi:hypothetical protein